MVFGRRRESMQEGLDEPMPPDVDPTTMNILRFLRTECIRMELHTRPSEPEPDETAQQREKRLCRDKERLLQELAEILEASGEIINPTRFFKELVNRERRATTGIAPGVAIPHVRSKQVRSFVMGFARAPGEGLYFDSLEGAPVRLFFMLASPAFTDRGYEKIYLQVYRQLAEMVRYDYMLESFIDAETPQDVLNVLRGFVRQ